MSEHRFTADFLRLPGGTVNITVNHPSGHSWEFDLSPDEWARAVAGASAQGAAPERVALIRNFHMHQAPADAGGWDGNGSPTDEFPAPTST